MSLYDTFVADDNILTDGDGIGMDIGLFGSGGIHPSLSSFDFTTEELDIFPGTGEYIQSESINKSMGPNSEHIFKPEIEGTRTHTPLSNSDIVVVDDDDNNNDDGETSQQDVKRKFKAACTNCRAAHIACSHDLPCVRCLKHGIQVTCVYLPRKRRTNFKRKKGDKDGIQHTMDSSLGNFNIKGNGVPSSPEAYGSTPSPPHSDVDDYTHFMSSDAHTLSKSSITTPPRLTSESSQTGEEEQWILTGSDEAISVFSSTPLSLTMEKSTTHKPLAIDWGKGVSHVSIPQDGSVQQVIQGLQMQNVQLGELLQNALKDIKDLKDEYSYHQRMEHLQLINLDDRFLIPPMSPAVAMIALSGPKRGLIVQCNEIFRQMLGYTWKEIQAGLGCIHLFPERTIPGLLCFATKAISQKKIYAEGTLIFTHKNGSELKPMKAKYQFTYKDDGQPLYKMLYVYN